MEFDTNEISSIASVIIKRLCNPDVKIPFIVYQIIKDYNITNFTIENLIIATINLIEKINFNVLIAGKQTDWILSLIKVLKYNNYDFYNLKNIKQINQKFINQFKKILVLDFSKITEATKYSIDNIFRDYKLFYPLINKTTELKDLIKQLEVKIYEADNLNPHEYIYKEWMERFF